MRPRFVRRYADLLGDATTAIERFAADVRDGSFPASAETYHAADGVTEALGLYGSAMPEPGALPRNPSPRDAGRLRARTASRLRARTAKRRASRWRVWAWAGVGFALVAVGLWVVVAIVALDDDDTGTASGRAGSVPERQAGVRLDASREAVAPFTGLTEVELGIGGDCERVVVADAIERARPGPARPARPRPLRRHGLRVRRAHDRPVHDVGRAGATRHRLLRRRRQPGVAAADGAVPEGRGRAVRCTGPNASSSYALETEAGAAHGRPDLHVPLVTDTPPEYAPPR